MVQQIATNVTVSKSCVIPVTFLNIQSLSHTAKQRKGTQWKINRKTGTKTGTAHLLLMSELLWEEQKKKKIILKVES